MTSKRPTLPEEAIKTLLQEHGLQQPSAPFSAALTQLVVAHYSPPSVDTYPAGAWVGKVILWGLAGTLLLLLVVFASPTLLLSVAGMSVGALAVGLGALIWLLKQSDATPQPFTLGAESNRS
jgi:hypothetical protein